MSSVQWVWLYDGCRHVETRISQKTHRHPMTKIRQKTLLQGSQGCSNMHANTPGIMPSYCIKCVWFSVSLHSVAFRSDQEDELIRLTLNKPPYNTGTYFLVLLCVCFLSVPIKPWTICPTMNLWGHLTQQLDEVACWLAAILDWLETSPPPMLAIPASLSASAKLFLSLHHYALYCNLSVESVSYRLIVLMVAL